jgi:hypothetical protein
MLNKEFGKWKVLQDCATEKAPLNRLWIQSVKSYKYITNTNDNDGDSNIIIIFIVIKDSSSGLLCSHYIFLVAHSIQTFL